MVHLNGQAMKEMTAMRVAIVCKFTDEVTHLTSDNVELKKQISDLQQLAAALTGPSPFGRSKV
jgi:hypothetical protein